MSLIARPNAYATSTEDLRYVGKLYRFSPGDGEQSFSLPYSVRLCGGQFWTVGSSIGDHIGLNILDESGVLVATYCDSLPVFPSSSNFTLSPPTAALLMSGMKIQTVYKNSGIDDVDLGIWFKWFEVTE